MKVKNELNKIIEGSNCVTKMDLFEEFSKKLNFPDYFGKNWDAFNECINDLSWLDRNKIILNIKNADLLLEDESPKELDLLISVLEDAVKNWKEKGSLKIIFQSESEIDPRLKGATAALN